MLKALNVNQAEPIIKRISGVTDFVLPDKDKINCFAKPVPFYQQTQLIELKIPQTNLYFFDGPQGTLSIPYGLNPFKTANTVFGLLLNKDTVTAYLGLYLKFYRNNNSTIQCIENLQDLNFREDISPAQRKVLSSCIQKLKLNDTNNDVFDLTGTILLGTGLFQTTFKIDAIGQVTIIKGDLLFADLPVVDLDLGF